MDTARPDHFKNQPPPPSAPTAAEQLLAHHLAILDAIADLTKTVSGHIAEERPLLRAVVEALPTKPDGSPDWEGHRAYHDAEIEEKRERAKLWRSLRAEVLTRGFWGLLYVLAFLVGYWWLHTHAQLKP